MSVIFWANVSSKPQAAGAKQSIPPRIDSARELIGRNKNRHTVHHPLFIPGHSHFCILLADADSAQASDLCVTDPNQALAVRSLRSLYTERRVT
jgi:hypothetical protein